jgi:hypothetical protein
MRRRRKGSCTMHTAEFAEGFASLAESGNGNFCLGVGKTRCETLAALRVVG